MFATSDRETNLMVLGSILKLNNTDQARHED